MRWLLLCMALFFASCAHQDLKAPYELGSFEPVNDQWMDEE